MKNNCLLYILGLAFPNPLCNYHFIKMRGTEVTIGQKVRTLYQQSETGRIAKPTKANLPLPSDDWFIIKFDSDGKRLCIHRSMFELVGGGQ